MALGPRLDLRQSQSLVMTPQLQQAIRLLALSNLEVEAFIADAMDQNPLLDIGENNGDGPGAEPPGEPDFSLQDFGGDDGAPQGNFSDGSADSAEAISRTQDAMDSPLDISSSADLFQHDCAVDAPQAQGLADGAGLDGSLRLDGIGGGGNFDGEDSGLEARLTPPVTLSEHLHAQIAMAADGAVLAIARQLIDNLDDAGYCTIDLIELSHALDVPLGLVEDGLAAVQSLDPSGVGARNLAECLAIQAREADRYDPCMQRLIANLDLVARGALPQLKRLCRVDDEDLADMIAELRAYDPRPGLRFGGEASAAVTPDLFVRQTAAGWAIEINADTLPRLIVNRQYYTEMTRDVDDKAAKGWLNEKLADANWLVRALDQRQRTILKVASEIVKQQDAFFRRGVEHLRPLTLRQVADAISMHESTVSRVTSHKYLACARGTYELKYFFTRAIASADGGEAVSASAVKAQIKALIDAEEPKKILSDDTLVDLLNAKGFDIARRTVAKYRESLGLGSSVQRRRQKALAGHR